MTDLKRLEILGLIERIEFSPKQALANLARARRDLLTASATLDVDEEWAYAIAYHAMLRAGRAFMLSLGFRPKGKDQHKTVGDFCTEALGREFSQLMVRFNRMRIKRNDFIYEPERPIPKAEAAQSLASARLFVEEIAGRINK